MTLLHTVTIRNNYVYTHTHTHIYRIIPWRFGTPDGQVSFGLKVISFHHMIWSVAWSTHREPVVWDTWAWVKQEEAGSFVYLFHSKGTILQVSQDLHFNELYFSLEW